MEPVHVDDDDLSRRIDRLLMDTDMILKDGPKKQAADAAAAAKNRSNYPIKSASNMRPSDPTGYNKNGTVNRRIPPMGKVPLVGYQGYMPEALGTFTIDGVPFEMIDPDLHGVRTQDSDTGPGMDYKSMSGVNMGPIMEYGPDIQMGSQAGPKTSKLPPNSVLPVI